MNGQPAQMRSGNVFEATIQASTGTNTFTVAARDTSGNVTTKGYQVEVGGAGASYTYDANGNLTQKVDGGSTWTYEWNAENQLKRVLKNGVEQARLSYDPNGRRVEKVAGAVTTSYLYDGAAILREVRGGTTVKYIHGPSTDEPLARDDGSGALTYYHVDGLGSVVRRTSQAGAVVHEYRYDAWGNIEAGTSEPGYAFTGREWDPETGLNYYRARYYDPPVGRFLSVDPRWTKQLFSYEYVDNAPVSYSDPSGAKKKYPLNIWPPSSEPLYHDALSDGLQEAYSRLSRSRCAAFFCCQGPETLQNLVFYFGVLPANQGAGHEPPGSAPFDVIINVKGAYFTATTGVIGIPGARFNLGSLRNVRAFILLHELGHRLSSCTGFTQDADDQQKNADHSKAVLDNCF